MSITQDQLSKKLLADFKEGERLRKLSNQELVELCIEKVEAEFPIMAEICRRLCPEYFEAMDAMDEGLDEEEEAIKEKVNQL